MNETSIEHLEKKRDGLRGAVAQLDQELREMAAALESKRMNRVATDGGLQVVEALLTEAKQPKETTKKK